MVASMASSSVHSGDTSNGVYPWELDEYYHDMLELLPSKKDEILAQVRRSESMVLNSMIGDRSSLTPWRLKTRKHEVSYYIDPTVQSPLSRFCCVSHTDASVKEIMKLFMVADTEELLKNVRIIYRNVKEAKILSVLERPTRKHPMRSVYVRYTSYETPKLMKNRDACVAVTTNVFQHSDGSTIGYCLFDSVEIDECPDRYESHGIVRGRMARSGFLFRHDGKPNARTKAVYLMELAAGGFAPQWTTRFYMGVFGGNLGRLCIHFARKALDPSHFVAPTQWQSKKRTKFCQCCMQSFSIWSTKYNCASCGEVVCSACTLKEHVSVQGAGIQRIRVCVVCLQRHGVVPTTPTKKPLRPEHSLDASSRISVETTSSCTSREYEVRDLLTRDVV